MKMIMLCMTLMSVVRTTLAQNHEAKQFLEDSIIINDYVAKECGKNESYKVISCQKLKDSIAQLAYVQQTYHCIPVYNGIRTFLIKDGSVIWSSGKHIQIQSASFVGEVKNAAGVQIALEKLSILYFPAKEKSWIDFEYNDKEQNYYCSQLSKDPLKARLIWFPLNSHQNILCYEITWNPDNRNGWISTILAAVDVSFITEYSLTNDQNMKIIDNESSELQENKHEYIPRSLNNIIEPSFQYAVYPLPFENPLSNLSPLLISDSLTIENQFWHFDGTAFHDSTRGNNVWVQEDRDRNNSTFGRSGLCTSASPLLQFYYQPDFSSSPLLNNNQQLAMAQVFYTINRLHDILKKYGFDESAGNFQQFNQTGLGNGTDYVIADVQDAGGLNNANFSTPPDGLKPRMQLYLFNRTSPMRDASLDNTVVVHEYMHGVTNRLTGGPTTTSCLHNIEQASEGWSDFLALMLTTNWSQMNTTSGQIPRSIGSYVTGNINGIRTLPYSSNKNINSLSYSNLPGTNGSTHKMGEIWCSALWDMTWNIIEAKGINPNLENIMNRGGNVISLELVLTALKLQPCQPGFLDARDAILKADTLLYNGEHSCAIWKAFAGRGMGVYAKQGSSNDYRDQTADFHESAMEWRDLEWGMPAPTEGVHTEIKHHFLNNNCLDVVDYKLVDTLPANITWISGGLYDSMNRTIQMNVNLNQNESDTIIYQVKINDSSYHTPFNLFIDTIKDNSIPSFWHSQTQSWQINQMNGVYSNRFLFCPNISRISDELIETVFPVFIPPGKTELHFLSLIQSEYKWDGGVVEVSKDGGVSWLDLMGKIEYGNDVVKLNTSENPLSGRWAFTGNQTLFDSVSIDLSEFAGDSLLIRFRFGSDASQYAIGWSLDDIYLVNKCMIRIGSVLQDEDGLVCERKIQFKNILQRPPCILPNILEQPRSQRVCAHSEAVFSILAEGDSLHYQWQKSIDGISFENILDATSPTVSIYASGIYMNGCVLRCRVIGSCGESILTDSASLFVDTLPIIPNNRHSFFRCESGNIDFSLPIPSDQSLIWDNSTFSIPQWMQTNDSLRGYWRSPFISDSLEIYATLIDTLSGCFSAEKIRVNLYVSHTPQSPSVQDVQRCGGGLSILRANHTDDCYVNWYSSATDTIPAFIATDSIFINATSTGIYYYAETRNQACVSEVRIPARINIMPLPPDISMASANSRCGPGAVQLKAISSSRSKAVWYLDSSCLMPLMISPTSGFFQFQVSLVNTTTHYYVVNKRMDNGCLSQYPKKITAIINPRPYIPVIQPVERCGVGRVVINGTVMNPNNEYIRWYSIESSPIAVGAGNRFVTPVLNKDSTYYAESVVRQTGCVSESKIPIGVKINKLPDAPFVNIAASHNTGLLTLSVNRTSDSLKYNWYIDSLKRFPISRGQDSITFNTPIRIRNVFTTSQIKPIGCESMPVRTAIPISLPPLFAGMGEKNR